MEEGRCQQVCRWCQWFSQMAELAMYCKFPFLYGDFGLPGRVFLMFTNSEVDAVSSQVECRCLVLDPEGTTEAMGVRVDHKVEVDLVVATMMRTVVGVIGHTDW